MKQARILLILVLIGLFGACSSYEEPALNGKASQSSAAENRLTVSQAESIASAIIAEFSENCKTRSDIAPEVEYVVRSSKTRSVASNDTIAYVFNYPDNGGFVMISPDPSLEEPLVAYSDKGHLDIYDDFVKDQIIFPLEKYIEIESSTFDPTVGIQASSVPTGFYDIIEEIKPQLIINLNQRSPWNKYVLAYNEHGPLVGCVNVACALIMSRCKSNFTFELSHFNFTEITKAIAIQQGVTGVGSSTYSYDRAVDDMAFLLWIIGNASGSEYTSSATVTTYANAISKMIEWGYKSSTSGLKYSYDTDTVKYYISYGNLVFLTGIQKEKPNEPGHAWVADGYQVRQKKSYIPGYNFPEEAYVHFNWGWGGNCNGYFIGSLYINDYYTYESSQYCAFRIENVIY